jgi:hypothetical protein
VGVEQNTIYYRFTYNRRRRAPKGVCGIFACEVRPAIDMENDRKTGLKQSLAGCKEAQVELRNLQESFIEILTTGEGRPAGAAGLAPAGDPGGVAGLERDLSGCWGQQFGSKGAQRVVPGTPPTPPIPGLCRDGSGRALPLPVPLLARGSAPGPSISGPPRPPPATGGSRCR